MLVPGLDLLAADPAADEPAGPSRRVTPLLSYDSTVLSNLAGGRRRGVTSVGNLHLKLTAQGVALGLPDTAAFVDVLSIHGGHPSGLVGDAQGTSNIEGPDGTQLEEA